MPVVEVFKCPNCGASLTNLKVSTGICEFCSTPYVIEGLKSYQEVLKSEGIKSGTAFTATPRILHDKLVEYLTSDRSAPVDILENTTIEACECFSVPSYYYHYNGTSDYMCEVGSRNKLHLSGGKSVTETQWSVVNGNIRAEVERIVSGNTNYDQAIDDVYTPFRSDLLIDIDSLSFDPSSHTVKYDRPQNVLLDQYVRPDMEKALQESASKQLDGKQIRNFSTGSSNIAQDGKIEKVIVGVYHLTLSYNGQKLDYYTTSDGTQGRVVDMPVDKERFEEINAIESALSKALKALDNFKKVALGAFIASFIFHKHPALLSGGMLTTFFSLYQIYMNNNRKKDTSLKKEVFEKVIPEIKEKFRSSSTTLSGYEKIKL